MHDKTLKALLALIVVALWGLLLRPLVTPTAVHAQTAAAPGYAVALIGNGIVVVGNGQISLWLYSPSNQKIVRKAGPIVLDH